MENPLVDILGPHLKRKRKKVTKKEIIWVKYNLQASVDPILEKFINLGGAIHQLTTLTGRATVVSVYGEKRIAPTWPPGSVRPSPIQSEWN